MVCAAAGGGVYPLALHTPTPLSRGESHIANAFYRKFMGVCPTLQSRLRIGKDIAPYATIDK